MFDAIRDAGLGAGSLTLLALALLTALAFEFVNGFHDTANAVATVIYTNTMRPNRAVVLSGLCNFCGVFVGGIAVAMSVVHLLPVDLLVSSGTGAGLAMVLSLLLAAILWNLGTWYLGLPASSSHTLIGAILGVGLANSLTAGHTFGDGVNWHKAGEVGLTLLLSPLLGFALSAALLLLGRRLVQDERLFQPPQGEAPPPGWIRGLLVTTCAGVSFAHGSNDGQKGVGLIMLILIGILPASFALDAGAGPERIEQARAAVRTLEDGLGGEGAAVALASTASPASPRLDALLRLRRLEATLAAPGGVAAVPRQERWAVRTDILLVGQDLERVSQDLAPERAAALRAAHRRLSGLTDYAPPWVLVLVALALGVGTTVGWKRIVVTVGEKIGEQHLTYAQGASAELVAMGTIGLSALAGLPVSTTHVLSSGVAGTMVAGRSALQRKTVTSIALAWVLTLPVSLLLSGVLFLLLRWLLG